MTEAAAGDRDGATVTLYPGSDPTNTGSTSTLKHGWVDAGRARDVPMLRLDRFFAEHAPGLRLAAIKIDVEGAEDRVVAGMVGERSLRDTIAKVQAIGYACSRSCGRGPSSATAGSTLRRISFARRSPATCAAR